MNGGASLARPQLLAMEVRQRGDYRYILEPALIAGGGRIEGGAGEREIASTAIVALDHGGEGGVVTRRANGGSGSGEGHNYTIRVALPKRCGPYAKVQAALTASLK